VSCRGFSFFFLPTIGENRIPRRLNSLFICLHPWFFLDSIGASPGLHGVCGNQRPFSVHQRFIKFLFSERYFFQAAISRVSQIPHDISVNPRSFPRLFAVSNIFFLSFSHRRKSYSSAVTFSLPLAESAVRDDRFNRS
jgi:hypothetical protein